MRGRSALHIACWYRYSVAITLLLKANADVHARDDQGNTPLHFLLSIHPDNYRRTFSSSATHMIDLGADIHAVNNVSYPYTNTLIYIIQVLKSQDGQRAIDFVVLLDNRMKYEVSVIL